MVNAKLVVILVLPHVATLGAGIWLGVEVVRRLSHFGDLEQLAVSQAKSSAVFNEPSADAARDVLLRNLNLLDRLGPTALPATEMAADRLVTTPAATGANYYSQDSSGAQRRAASLELSWDPREPWPVP